MTPQDKAFQLWENFYVTIPDYPDYLNIDEKKLARIYALIAVEEILKNYGSLIHDSSMLNDKYFWKDVKEEIQKL